MSSGYLSLDDLNQKVKSELLSVSIQVRQAIEPFLVIPYLQMRNWDYASRDGQSEVLPCWIIDDLRKIGISIGFAYSQYGHGNYGSPWGLIFLDDDQFGPNVAWYHSLEIAVVDSGYLEDMIKG